MDQTNSIRIRKSVSKAELKNRLYDKGISIQTMPSVKRPIPENVRTFAAKLSVQNKPPLYINKPPPPIPFEEGFMGRHSVSQLGINSQQQFVQSKHMKTMSSDPFLKTGDRFGKQSINRDSSPNDGFGERERFEQEVQGFRPQTSTIATEVMRGGSQMGKSVSNPQFTTLNMAPYSRPQTQAFGYRGQQMQRDPSKKVTRTSEEITSITGLKTMTPLGPSALNRPKTSSMDLLKKRSMSNKALKRRIIGGKSQLEEKIKILADKIIEEDDERRLKQLQSSPNLKPSEKVVGGNQEVTDEILRQHYLMAKIRGKAETPTIQRPSTTDGIFHGDSLRMPLLNQDSQRQISAFSNFRMSQQQKQVSQTAKNLGQSMQSRSPFNNNIKFHDQIDENVIEEDNQDDFISNSNQIQKSQNIQQQLDSSKSDRVVTNLQGRTQGKQQVIVAKWNDLDKLITLLQNQPDDDGYFIYLKPSEIGDPYDLLPLIEAEQQNKNQMKSGIISKSGSGGNKQEKFFTLSKKGITTYMNDEPVEYISLTDWLIERNFFQQISEKKFFKQFRRWKIVRMWRRNILQKKREEVKNNLIEKLFILDDVFGQILMSHRSYCKDMEALRIIDLQQPGHEVFTINEFASNQTKQRENVVNRIEETSGNCRNMFVKGINDVLEEQRQKINDQNEDEENHKKEYMRGGQEDGGAKEKKTLNSDPVFEQLGFKHNLKYGPRSKLRRACSRFLRFSYLLDFVALDALSNIYIQSVRDTIIKLKDLSSIQVDYELKSSKVDYTQGGIQGTKKLANQVKEMPFFSIEGQFEEQDIPRDYYIVEKVDIFEPPPVGNSKIEDFDPTVHLEIFEKKDDEEIMEIDINAIDEDSKIERKRVKNLNKIWLNVSPQRQDFSSLLNECFQEGLECLKHFERWSRHEDLLKYVKVLESWDDKVCDEWDPPDDNNLNCEEWLQENPYFIGQSKKINKYLGKAFDKVYEFFGSLEIYLFHYWQNKQLGNFEIIENENLKNPIDILPILLQRFNDQKANFENFIPEYRVLGMIKVNLKDVKNKLTPNPKNCFNQLKIMLPRLIQRRIDVSKQWLLQQIESIIKPPNNVESYVKQIQCLDYIDKNYQQVKDKVIYLFNDKTYFLQIELNNQLFQICQQFEIVNKEEKNQKFIVEVYQIINTLSNTINEANEAAGKRKEAMKIKISNKVPKIKKKVEDFNDQITKDKFLDIKSNMYEILNEIDIYEKVCKTLVEKAKKIEEFQKTLEMDVMNFNYVEEVKISMAYRARLWKALNEWTDLVESWQGAMFDQIEVNVISQKSEIFTKTALQCERQFPQSSAVAYLKKLVFDFKETMPIVEALAVKLEPEHWKEIKEILKIPEDFALEEKQFKLSTLISLKAADYQEEIVNVSTTAIQEANLRAQLQEINDIWDKVQFTVQPHTKSDQYKLTELDKIQTILDESLSNISNIVASRYVKRLQPKPDECLARLILYSDTIEQWKEFQRNWLYLDNILSSQEIRRQLGSYINLYDQNIKSWVKLMKDVSKNPLVKKHCTLTKNLENFKNWNDVIDQIQKRLDQFLEDRRQNFPRFYFLSDDELLQIQANSTDVKAIQRHINKFFDNISELQLVENVGYDIVGLVSSEKEKIEFKSNIKTSNQNVEKWMSSLEEKMIDTIKKKIKEGQQSYNNNERNEWVLMFWGQVVAVVAQIQWTYLCESYIQNMDENPFGLEDFFEVNKEQLVQLTKLIRGDLDEIKRKILVSLITTDIHGRDIVENLSKERVTSVDDFNWQQQLRYYSDENPDSVVTVRQVNAMINYGYEYMGATTRLVITPLTDRCWMTITGAMHINLGAAPAGPAGTGKTESTKDLAKALGIYCVVFNCSDQIEYRMMARLFSGLAQTGAWSCLDEFNRINVEVLSVIAQQLLDINQAKNADKTEFNFNGKENMTLKKGCGVFVTMNPGYAGRAELPDNLKVLFRPVSMMIPAYGLIAEIMLQAEGFENAKNLSTKMVQLYKLASEQLSQQDHYDFGMRAVKSVLVMAGTLKRANPTISEDVVLIRAMRDSNIPKFLADDIPLFQALIQDLFPSVEIPDPNYGDLEIQIRDSIIQKGFQLVNPFITKVIQLFDTFNVRFGVMIVGPTGAGKSTCYTILQDAMTQLRISKSVDKRFQKVFIQILNPKSITMGELYGEENKDTSEWADGLASKIIRSFAKEEDSERRNWCIFDGPVDALWIENMNTVLDDNMTLCLANGERIKLNWQMRMLFEVQDLSVASPATVSRCGMVYMTPSDLGWRPYMKSWLEAFIKGNKLLNEEGISYLEDQFNLYVDIAFERIKAVKDEEAMATVPIQVIKCICNFLEYFIKTKNFPPEGDKKETERKINYFFGYSFIWSFCSSYKSSAMKFLDNMMRDFFSKLHIPPSDTVFDYFYNQTDQKITQWEKIVPQFEYDPKTPFFSLLVPTVETVKYTALLDMLVQINKPVFFTGNTGVGKSIIIQKYLSNNQEKQGLAPIILNFSAQTNSLATQKTIEGKLDRKKKTVLGAKGNQTCVIFVDDVNMPMVEQYGAQPPVELLRQLLDQKGFYDRPEFYWKNIEKFLVLCSAAPPGGGRSALTPRFMRQFHIFNLPDPSEYSMKKIFENIIDKFLAANYFTDQVKKCGSIAVAATIELYVSITNGLLPIPAKFHYTFNLRDIAKVFQGMLMTKNSSINTSDIFTRLWIHECSRVFNDRLINQEDREFFRETISDLVKQKFKVNWSKEDIFNKGQIIFSILVRLDSEDKLYEENQDKNKVFKVLEDKLIDYNQTKNVSKMDLVFFDDAINHVCRIARILGQPRGNAMLIGVSGCGKQSLTRLASFMLEYNSFQIKLSKNYKAKDFRNDLKVKMLDSGCDAIQNTFLMTDTQIMDETFLEDLNNILNTGEITNLYIQDDLSRIYMSLTKAVQLLKRPDSNDYKYLTYIERLRDNFHIILCMSPVGDQLRIRCRKFPSLVNCCTLDWFDNWPEDALLDVSQKFLKEIDNETLDAQSKQKLSKMFMKVHKSVEEYSVKFYDELRRMVYITPKSYLDGINLFLLQLKQKRTEYKDNIGRLQNGIQKLEATNQQIAGLKVYLIELAPKLEIEKENAKIQEQEIKQSKQIATAKETEVEHEAAIVEVEAQKINILKKEAQVELDKAKPALEEADKAVSELSKDDVTELKTNKAPTAIVEKVLQCVLLYLDIHKYDLSTAQKVMNDIKFLEKLKNYNKENISQNILTKVSKIVTDPQFDPYQITKNINKAAGGLAKWCKAIREYAMALKIVRPKEQKVKDMTDKFNEAMKEVALKQNELQQIKDKLQFLEQEYDKTKAYIEQLNKDQRTCERRLGNAEKLMDLLKDEGERWKVQVEELLKSLVKLNGNVFIAAASISYIGPFTGSYRDKLIENWTNLCQSQQIEVSEKYSLVNTLGDPVQIRNWNLASLPSDSVSIDNGIIATKTQRWPLMIDPQTQANSWIKKMHRESGIICLKLNSGEGPSYQKDMELALSQGSTVLIEDIYQEIDPGLDSVLTKSINKIDGDEKISFGDKSISYDRNFRLYITTKLSNPHFLPEICIKLTVINFTVTFDGLEEQMLADVVVKEAPEVEIKRDQLVMMIAENKNELKRLENKILKDLAQSNQDTILDNEELIETLQFSKNKSKTISVSLIEAEEVEITINKTRNSYRNVSIRGSILYFVIADLAGIDPMYQNSLKYVKKLFNDAISSTPPQEDLAQRIVALENQITKTLYINICRGLFEAHKLIYSFLICSSIKRKAKQIDEISWNYLLRGAGIFNKQEQPDRVEEIMYLISDNQWDLIYCLQQNVPQSFKDFCPMVVDHIGDWENYVMNEDEFYLEKMPCGLSSKLTMFEKLLVLKIFKPEKLLFAFSKYVELELGKIYAESPISTMDALFADSNSTTPIIFVLSQGADPTSQVLEFAKKSQFDQRFEYKSLGQGQEKVAHDMIEKGKKEGNWVLLQNCHLFRTWMNELEAICERFNQEEDKINSDFRLIMTSMPVDYFPAAILQNGLKMTTEPPRGIKANLKRSYNNIITDQEYQPLKNTNPENPDNSQAFIRLLFGLCFFHSLVQERRKFGPLGWNIKYEFNDSDLDTSIKMLRNFLDDAPEIPWDAMKYMTGQINYGGRVTDDWDRILLLNILSKFYNEDILTENFQFSSSGIYYLPTHSVLEEIQIYIEGLPQTEEPEVFGMHQNANIAYQQQESEKIVQTILNVQPRVVVGAGGKSSDDIIYELSEELQANIPPLLDKEDHHKEIFKPNNKGLLHCLSTVLLQEIEKYNKLINKMVISLANLMKAIKGLVIMSPELDLMYSSLIKNQVPPNWQEVSYPSLKPLSSWIKDLNQRVEFMRNWLKNNHPACYWLSGFFFPHGFMTGTLQTFARKYLKAIDLLEFKFKVLKNTDPQDFEKAPEDGVYVYGLFIEGAKWSFTEQCLEEQGAGEMTFQMPIIHFLPTEKPLQLPSGVQHQQKVDLDLEDLIYKCPCYKTNVRAGILSTTGQSTNFILAIDLPCLDSEPPEHWTLRGTALLSMLND